MNAHILVVALLIYHTSPSAAILWPPRCYKKLDFGSCDATQLKWYYEPEIRGCKMFSYTGCGGNWNRFPSERKCLQSCLMTYQPELFCSAKPNPGNCKAYRPMWYFDDQVGYCRGFVYGGCGGNRNTFPSCRACMSRCASYDANILCRYLEVEFFRKFIAGKLVFASPPFSPVKRLEPRTPVAPVYPAWRAAQPSLRSALHVMEAPVKSAG